MYTLSEIILKYVIHREKIFEWDWKLAITIVSYIKHAAVLLIDLVLRKDYNNTL